MPGSASMNLHRSDDAFQIACVLGTAPRRLGEAVRPLRAIFRGNHHGPRPAFHQPPLVIFAARIADRIEAGGWDDALVGAGPLGPVGSGPQKGIRGKPPRARIVAVGRAV